MTGNFTCSGLISIYGDGSPSHVITSEGRSVPVILLPCPSTTQPPISLHLPTDTKVISIEVSRNAHADEDSADAGMIGGFSDGLVTSRDWKCADTVVSDEWRLPGYNDSSWLYAKVVHTDDRDDDEEGVRNLVGIPDHAKWITYAGVTRKSLCRIKRKL